MRSIRAASLGTSALENIEMEAAVDRRSVALGELARQRLLIAPAPQQVGIEPARQQRRLGRGPEDHARARSGGAGYLMPQRAELGVGHPVLGIEQDIAVARGVG